MLPANKDLIAGLKEAIRTVERFDQQGVEVPGGFVVVDAEPWFTGPVARAQIGAGPSLPFGSSSKVVPASRKGGR